MALSAPGWVGEGPKAGGEQCSQVSSVDSSGVSLKLSILLPILIALVLLLLVAASLLVWRVMKRQKEGERTWLGLGWGWAGWKYVGQWLGWSSRMQWSTGLPTGLGRDIFPKATGS